MHCSEETKPQFLAPSLRSRHHGRQAAAWASAGVASIIGASDAKAHAIRNERIEGMPTLPALAVHRIERLSSMPIYANRVARPTPADPLHRLNKKQDGMCDSAHSPRQFPATMMAGNPVRGEG
jgi:hypothetical protein